MNRVYVITKFDLKTDIPMKYALKYRDLYYNNLKEILSFSVEGTSLGHVKVSQWEDEEAYNFILKQL